MPAKFTQENWVKWMQSIEDAARALKDEPARTEYWPKVFQIDEDLWDMHRTIVLEERANDGS